MSGPSLRQAVADQAHALGRQATNAARRNKPTMWAYYDDMARWLQSLQARDAEALESMLRSYANVEPVDMEEPPLRAARRWAQGVYARRILAAAGIRTPRPSLVWLRARAA